MNQIFNYENPVMQGICKLAYCIFLSVLWLVCCIPVVTIVPATCALYYAAEKSLKNGWGYEVQSFFHAFRKNLKQTLPFGLFMLAVEAVFWSDRWILKTFLEGGHQIGNGYVLFTVLMAAGVVYMVWTVAGIARFNNTVRAIMKNSLILMIRHLGTSILILLILAFACFIVWLIPVSVCLMPAVAMWLISAGIEKIFVFYQPEEAETER